VRWASPRARCTAVSTAAARRSSARAGRDAVPGQMTLADGARLRVRPIDPADRGSLADAFERLSDRSRHQRFLGPKPRLTTRELDYLTDVDHVTHEALVAIDETSGQIVGVGRYATGHGGGTVADMALAVTDAWQRRGIGHALAALLVERARANGMTSLTGMTMAGNRAARAVLDRLGFRVCSAGGGVLEVALDLPRAAPARPRYRGASMNTGSSSRERRSSLAKTRVR
jgi:ribosomal protein S18 acetylase RimI-like enzyme